jgi:hypothetical protein
MQRLGGGERKVELETLAERSTVIDHHHDTAMGLFVGDAQSVPNGSVRCAAVNFFGS